MLLGADLVGVSHDVHLEDVRVGANEVGHLADDGPARVVDARVVGVEVDDVVEHDAITLDARGPRGERAAIRLGIVGGDAGKVRTGVVRVGDAVVVAIGRRAAVGLGVLGADALGVGTRVLVVEHAVSVTVGARTTVRLRIVGSPAGDVGARVLVVEHAVAVAVRARAAVRLGIARPPAGDVGARVLVVEDAVSIAVGALHLRAEPERQAEREDVCILRLHPRAELEDLRVPGVRSEVEAPGDAEVPSDVGVERGAHDVTRRRHAPVHVDPQTARLGRKRPEARSEHRAESDAGALRGERGVRGRRSRGERRRHHLGLDADGLREGKLERERRLTAEAELGVLGRADGVGDSEGAVHAHVLHRRGLGRRQQRAGEPQSPKRHHCPSYVELSRERQLCGSRRMRQMHSRLGM